ncbi:MAG TPA: hypothetical protein VJY65_04970 [Chloroflexota bacterium]|nr:hypothetical protein [Chloroflexota bacterium]
MPPSLQIVGETWYIYAIAARERYHDVTLPVTTYMACKKSERGPENYEIAWQRYLRARQVVTMHPAYGGSRHGEPRVLYDPVCDDVYWLFKQNSAGDFVVTPRVMPELDALTLHGHPPQSVQVRVPSLVSDDEDMPKAG